jgi:hypothetical protein
MNGFCRLCNTQGTLRSSHIIPKFVTRWLKESSATGYMRDNRVPNRRSQDGLKLPLLCHVCEERFSNWETKVAERIFHPFNRTQTKLLHYEGEWLLKFAVSVSWRSLAYYLDLAKDTSDYPKASLPLLDKAIQTWKEFIFDQRPHPGSFEQHLILFDSIAQGDIYDLPPNINRFLVRGLHLNLALTDGDPAFIFTKMGRMGLFGFINVRHPRRWIGTKIHVKRGQLRGEIGVSQEVFNYLIERANLERLKATKLSPKQKEIIALAYRNNPDRAVASETWQAMGHDVRLFGDEAFIDPEEE